MKVIKLIDMELLYIPGDYSYNQRIRGRKNYEHSSGNEYYNGCGGKQVFTGSKLTMYGVTDDNKEIGVSVKSDILQTFARNKLNESFINKLQNNMPNSVELEQDETGSYHLSRESCIEIFRAIHPHKKLNI